MIEVSAESLLWDGVEWVPHNGLVAKGVKRTINFGGAWMTPNHEVLVNEQWLEAQRTDYEEATASFATTYGVPQHVSPSSVCSVSKHAGPMCIANTSGVSQLRRQGYHGVSEVGSVVCRILEGHGADVQTGADARSIRQQQWVQEKQLRMGYPEAAVSQPPQQHIHRYAERKNACAGSYEVVGLEQNDVALSCREVACREAIQPTRQKEIESREEQVFDLMDAGPRHRFTVRGYDGRPFLVHNCQHIARLIVMEQTLELDKIEPVALSCHDEGVFLPAEDNAEAFKAHAIQTFSKSPEWWPELPLAAEADIGPSYGSAK